MWFAQLPNNLLTGVHPRLTRIFSHGTTKEIYLTLDPKINKSYPWQIGSPCVKFHDNKYKENAVMHWHHLPYLAIFSYQCIVTLTFELLTRTLILSEYLYPRNKDRGYTGIIVNVYICSSVCNARLIKCFGRITTSLLHISPWNFTHRLLRGQRYTGSVFAILYKYYILYGMTW